MQRLCAGCQIGTHEQFECQSCFVRACVRQAMDACLKPTWDLEQFAWKRKQASGSVASIGDCVIVANANF